MNILAIETSHSIGSVAIVQNDKILGYLTTSAPSKQAEELIILIENALSQSNFEYNDLNAIAVNIGPGSFTGVRIGLAAAHGISLAAKLPVIGITSFEAATVNITSRNTLTVLDARRNQIFVQYMQNSPQLLDYEEITSLKLENGFTLVGTGVDLVSPILKAQNHNFTTTVDNSLPTAKDIANAFFKKSPDLENAVPTSPLYIRKPDAKKMVSGE